MKRLRELTSALLELPHYLVPPSILKLGEKFESAAGWASERVFSSWVAEQEWRQCLPPIFEISVERANMLEHSKLKTIKLGIFLPHEIASAFYHFRSGDLFFSLLTGTPDDISNYWNNNTDLAEELRCYWGESDDAPMDQAVSQKHPVYFRT